MEDNKIMVSEEVIENVDEITENSGSGWLIAAGIGATILVGVGVYKLVKKIRANIKAKKEEVIECDEYDEVETDEVSEEA